MQDNSQTQCIPQLFETQVNRSPAKVAVIFETEQLTYEELNKRANRLAHYLRKRHIGHDVTVGIYLNRSLNMIVSILAVLKAGGAYVPLDPENPIDRNSWILRETQTNLLLTEHSLTQNVDNFNGKIVCLDCESDVLQNEDSNNPPATDCPDDLAYVMYTSGSTGEPKGVSVAHRGIVNYLSYLINTYVLDTDDVVLQLPPFSFDASVRDLIGPLTAGATVVLLQQGDQKNPFVLLQKIHQHKVTCLLSLTPTVLMMLADCASEDLSPYNSIRLLLVSGEVFPPYLVPKTRQLFGENVGIVNQYGPTEGTLTCTYFPIPTNLRNTSTIPIGRPISNCRIYILDENLNPVTRGERGELHIGGVGVVRGYFNRPELTAQKFITNPFSPGELIYKTGDLARHNSDGDIEFLGRIDHQIKIRSFRIEPEEIEIVLSDHPGIKQSIVVASEDLSGDKKLVAYVVAAQLEIPSSDELRSFLQRTLPEYMVPSVFIFLDSLPVSVNGKTDRLAISAWQLPANTTALKHLTDKEEQRVLVDWNHTKTDYPRDHCIHELFEEQVARTPDAVALVSQEEFVTYEELNHKANCLAWTLKNLGVRTGSRVGILAHRSIATITGMLSILKAGGVYVPLDPEYPEERLDFLLKDTDPVVLLIGREQARSLPNHKAKVLLLEEPAASGGAANPNSEVTAENLCYIMYTSGSTGQPKGVCIPHRGVVRLVKNTNYVNLSAEETLLQLCPLSFDVSTFEIWGALLNGARLIVPPAGRLSTQEIGNVLQKYHVTTLWLTSWLFHEMVDSNLLSLSGVHQLLAGGDVLSVTHVKRVLKEFPDCQFINGYGPTENTTFSCCYSVRSADAIEKSVPIGPPIANSTVYILDDKLEPVAIGEIGEIYLGGDGLARGYLNRQELTAEKFITNPFNQDGSQLYKSGDLGRWLPEGIIEFLGRVDDQVKIRGFRVEPGEIETVLTSHPAIRQAVVMSLRNRPGENRLIAYMVCHEKNLNLASELREFLKQRLPNYMMPSEFVFLDTFPLSPNGKIDRRALPEPANRREPGRSGLVPPRTKVEEGIQAIWEEVLAKNEIGVEDDFFEIGGDSLSATRVVSRIRRRFNVELPLHVLFEQPTIASLASMIQQSVQSLS